MPTADPGPEAQPETDQQENPPVQRHAVGAVFAGLLAVLGLVVIVMSSGYGWGSADALIGPGGIPGVLGVLLVLGGLVVAAAELQEMRRIRRSPDATSTTLGPPENSWKNSYLQKKLLQPALVVLIISGGVLLTPIFGLIISMALTVGVIAVVLERIPLYKASIMAASAGLVMWLIFSVLLSVRFPDSWIGL